MLLEQQMKKLKKKLERIGEQQLIQDDLLLDVDD